MNILLIAFIYNELPYIGDLVKYYKKQDVNIYIIDNYSTDGSYEWLLQNDIECSRFDTGCSFDLRLLQAELTRILHIKKPEWFVYAAADLYYVLDSTIKETIEKVNKEGYNQIKLPCYGALNTGEEFKTPLYKTYSYGRCWKDLIMISKYHKDLKMNGDNIIIPDINEYKPGGIMVNYGACKPIKEQKIKLKRRKKAWRNGLNRNTGRHFIKGEAISWTWPKLEVDNLHHCKDAKYFKRLCNEN